jgi:hypothetical protein
MIHTSIIRARCEPGLAEDFALASRLSGRSASAVLRDLMREFVHRAVNDEGHPEVADASDNAALTQQGGRT